MTDSVFPTFTKPELPMHTQQIREYLPHRYPFLLVDRVTEVSDNGIVGYKNVSINEEFLQGHFPEYPIMPGVLIVEALAQTGAIYLLSKKENKGKIPFFAGIQKMHFHHMVVPGDVLKLKVQFIKEKMGFYFANVEAYVEDDLAAKGTILCSLGD